MDLQLEGKSVLVTGGSKGIGFACAQAFAREGADLHLVARSRSDLESARSKLMSRYDVKVECHPCDLGSTQKIGEFATSLPPPDILVNNAGSIPGGRIAEVDDRKWRDAWDLKVFGYINMTRAFYGEMCARGSGAILNIIGLGGERHRAQYIAGCSGNAALMAFTRALGAESVDHGVRVVGINPGRVITDRQISHLREEALHKLGSADRWTEIRDIAARELPFGRFIDVTEVADLIIFLASARASYMSATVVTIDGGQSLRPRT